MEHTWETEECVDLCTYEFWFTSVLWLRMMYCDLCYARISMKRESAVSKEVLAELSSGSGKKLTKAEKDERYVNFWVN